MWRAFFLAIGIFCCTVGAECLLIDKAVIITSPDAAAGPFGQSSAPRFQEISPPDWAPWSLLAGGSVVMIYSFTIPRRVKE